MLCLLCCSVNKLATIDLSMAIDGRLHTFIVVVDSSTTKSINKIASQFGLQVSNVCSFVSSILPLSYHIHKYICTYICTLCSHLSFRILFAVCQRNCYRSASVIFFTFAFVVFSHATVSFYGIRVQLAMFVGWCCCCRL